MLLLKAHNFIKYFLCCMRSCKSKIFLVAQQFGSISKRFLKSTLNHWSCRWRYVIVYFISCHQSMPQWFYRSPWERYHLQWICGLIPILCHSWPWLCIGLKGHMKRQLVGKNWFLSYKPIWLDSRESQDAMMANIWLTHSFMWQIAWRLLKMYFPQHSILI